MSGVKRKRNVLNVKQKLEILQKLDNGESASTDVEDVLNEGSTISHSASLQSVETLLDYSTRDEQRAEAKTHSRFFKAVNVKRKIPSLMLYSMQIHYTHLHSGLDFSLHTLCDMAGVTEAQALVMRRRRSCNVGEGVAYTCPFMCPHKKKSNGVKSGGRGVTTKSPYVIT
ncbi:hypothetical protein AVEN_46180-1 [Araneus ventricosus]|uniref:HTH psq-type domain-containing protein n=1 Tax=Araneus ventricosus TaxID=182803 RepID=A0A4Y2E8R1_ARAVE|nr:hypothetical protein AVEN_46180-1 [Araneus ventricosus]